MLILNYSISSNILKPSPTLTNPALIKSEEVYLLPIYYIDTLYIQKSYTESLRSTLILASVKTTLSNTHAVVAPERLQSVASVALLYIKELWNCASVAFTFFATG